MCASNQIRFLKYRKSTLCVAGPRYGSCEALPREDDNESKGAPILMRQSNKIAPKVIRINRGRVVVMGSEHTERGRIIAVIRCNEIILRAHQQFRPPIALHTALSHITTELWEIPVLRMAH